MAIEHRLQIDPANALQRADEEGVHGDKFPGLGGLDMSLSEFGTEALEQADLRVAELEATLGHHFLQAQEPLVLGQ